MSSSMLYQLKPQLLYLVECRFLLHVASRLDFIYFSIRLEFLLLTIPPAFWRESKLVSINVKLGRRTLTKQGKKQKKNLDEIALLQHEIFASNTLVNRKERKKEETRVLFVRLVQIVVISCSGSRPSPFVRDNHRGTKRQKRMKGHTTVGIRWWSPTQLLIYRSKACVWQSGRDAQFSLVYGRTWQIAAVCQFIYKMRLYNAWQQTRLDFGEKADVGHVHPSPTTITRDLNLPLL